MKNYGNVDYWIDYCMLRQKRLVIVNKHGNGCPSDFRVKSLIHSAKNVDKFFYANLQRRSDVTLAVMQMWLIITA